MVMAVLVGRSGAVVVKHGFGASDSYMVDSYAEIRYPNERPFRYGDRPQKLKHGQMNVGKTDDPLLTVDVRYPNERAVCPICRKIKTRTLKVSK